MKFKAFLLAVLVCGAAFAGPEKIKLPSGVTAAS